jgi:hypothetical protein
VTITKKKIKLLPSTLDLDVYRGDDLRLGMELRSNDESPIDVTGWEIRAQVRKRPRSNTLLASFTVEITDAEAGTFDVVLSAADTAGLPQVAVWDLETVDAQGETRTRVAGEVRMYGEVTLP